MKIQDKYQAEIDEISLSGPIAMGDSITVQFPYVFEDEKRYEFHVSVDADNEITEIFEGICNWQTQGQEDNCQRFEVYAVTVIDTWISNLSIAEEEGAVSPKLLSSGIYEAMLTTAAGLFVGIIAYLAYNYLVSRVEKLIHKMEYSTIEFIETLQSKR